MRLDACRCVLAEVAFRIVSELCHIPSETPGEHRDLRGHADAHRCCTKSLIGTALVGFGVRQHARAESISKRAPSTTRTSLHFRINNLQSRLVRDSGNCDTSPDVPRSLMSASSIAAGNERIASGRSTTRRAQPKRVRSVVHARRSKPPLKKPQSILNSPAAVDTRPPSPVTPCARAASRRATPALLVCRACRTPR